MIAYRCGYCSRRVLAEEKHPSNPHTTYFGETFAENEKKVNNEKRHEELLEKFAKNKENKELLREQLAQELDMRPAKVLEHERIVQKIQEQERAFKLVYIQNQAENVIERPFIIKDEILQQNKTNQEEVWKLVKVMADQVVQVKPRRPKKLKQNNG